MYDSNQVTVNSNVQELTWTGTYKINGQTIRGFAISEHGQKWYVKWSILNEEDKFYFSSFSLTGSRFYVQASIPEETPRAHTYAFNMESYLKSNGAIGQLQVENYTYIAKEKSFSTFMADQRFRLKEHIRFAFPKTLQAEAEALLIGSREEMAEDLQVAYQTLGITHLFAISGLHVGLMVLLLYEAFLRLRVRKEMANTLLLILLPLYGFIAGGAPSVWRAISVSFLLLLSLRFRKKMSIEDAFALSIIGFIWISPWVLFQIGFQLSYLAAFFLIYSSKILLTNHSYILQSLLITFLCQIAVYPILLYHFYEISISSFIANLLFVPLFSFIILPSNILLLLVSFLHPILSNFLFTIYEPFRMLIHEVILFLSSLPYQLWNPMKPTIFLVVISYIGVFSFLTMFENRQRLVRACLFLIIPIFFIQIMPYLDSSTRITFINVGQGDCIVIELPYRKKTIMIDTGGVLRFDIREEWKKNNREFKVGEQVVVPFLKGKGIHKLDALILTHADADHMEGADEVLEGIEVKEIHISPGSLNEAIMQDLKDVASRQGVPIIEKSAGDYFEVGSYIFTYLYPLDSRYEGNNDSLILSMKSKYFHGLFLGDIEKQGELDLVEMYGKNLEDITVMKLGHHGSKTSSDQLFLEHTNPLLAIITAGFNNRYGHPHQEVTDRLDVLRIPYLQTGVEGAIEVKITRNGLITYIP